ncbi:hypothetical protein [Legionella rowbothamii]|uniref:hypothetical protein n=1 Tax=Legionella rowbothamii TaxID=96229 RepID=UPI0010544257|nr:hypothetical protein [Legionella rowbothamii]
MSKLNLKWIIISLILIAPYIELARLLVDYFAQGRDIMMPSIFTLDQTRKLGEFELYTDLLALKYFFLWYGMGAVVGLRNRLLSVGSEESVYSWVYLFSFIAVLFILLALVLEGLVYLFQLYPFMVISSFLIILSLIATRRTIVHSAIIRKKK